MVTKMLGNDNKAHKAEACSLICVRTGKPQHGPTDDERGAEDGILPTTRLLRKPG